MNPAEELPLQDILRLYNQPINEEQAWAVCYQSCRRLATDHGGRRGRSSRPTTIGGAADVRIQKDGSVRVEYQGCEGTALQRGFIIGPQK